MGRWNLGNAWSGNYRGVSHLDGFGYCVVCVELENKKKRGISILRSTTKDEMAG